MNYVAVSARFHFFNGVKEYTVEYAYAHEKWYVFKDRETSGAVFIVDAKLIKGRKVIDYFTAGNILNEYLEKTGND